MPFNTLQDLITTVESLETSVNELQTPEQIGIGTTSPICALDVQGVVRIGDSASSNFRIDLGSTGVGTYRSAYVEGLNNDILFANQQNGNLRFFTNNSEKMRITAGGNVGIGTTTPATALDVIGTVTLGGPPDPQFIINLGRGTAFNRHGYIAGTGTAIEFNNQQNGPLYFSTNNSEKMRITEGGNVGIGTHAPLDRLDIASGAATFRARFRNTTANEAFASFQNTNTGTTTGDGLVIGINASAVAYLWNHENSNFIIGNNNVERMRITAGGEVICGPVINANTNEGVVVVPSNGAGVGYIAIYHTSADVGNNWYTSFVRNNVQVGNISSSGTTGVAYNTTSDYRLKTNVQPFQNGLSKVKALLPSKWEWSTDNSGGSGFIAHELQAVIPEAVTGTKDAVDADGKPIYQAVDYGKLTTVLVAAVKELTAKVEALETHVASLAVP